MPAEIVLDVSHLEPPEPLVLTLETAEQLQTGQYIRMLHRREPCMLYDNLDSRFRHYQRKGSSSAVEVFIWLRDDAETTLALQTITGERFDMPT